MATVAETRPRMSLGWERYAPLAGALAVIGWVIGIILVQSVADKNKGPEILAAYQAHDDRILAGGLIWLIGTALFIWFLGSLRTRLLAAEGAQGRVSSIAFAGGVATTICLALVPGPDMAGALNKNDIDASAASAMHHLADAFFIGAEYLLPVLLAGTALVARRTQAVLPRWLTWVTLLIALVLLIGPIGWAALIFAFPLWVLVVTYLLWRAQTEPAGR